MMPFVESIHRTVDALSQTSLDFDVLYITGESLVQRARNNAVCAFLESRFQRLLFIDADIEFQPEDIQKLWNLDEPVCCGTYPFKRIGMKTTAWKDRRLVDLDQLHGPTEIDYAATGFLMVKREVFEDMREAYPERKHMEGLPDGNFDDRKESFAWFDPRVTDVYRPEDRVYLSEDYSFSLDYRNMGGRIILDPSIKLRHYGTYGFGE
jgi:glycosyltransferase involved in cell wall biosynthesis